MASSRERPWSNDEKNSLLAEIIKAHSPHPSVLLNVIRNFGVVQPPWEDVPLPYGRTMNESQRVFGELMRQPGQAGPQPIWSTQQTIGTSSQVKRAGLEGPQYSGGREIRPKPMSIPSYGQPSSSEGPVKRKRGRPTNASLAAKRAEESARGGQVGPATPTHAAASLSQISPTEFVSSTYLTRSEDRPLPSNVPGRMHIGSILTATPDAQRKTSSHSSSSSGKRRRIRMMRKEEESSAAAISRSQDAPRLSTSASFEDTNVLRPPYLYSSTDPGTPSRTSPKISQPPPANLPSVSQPPSSRP